MYRCKIRSHIFKLLFFLTSTAQNLAVLRTATKSIRKSSGVCFVNCTCYYWRSPSFSSAKMWEKRSSGIQLCLWSPHFHKSERESRGWHGNQSIWSHSSCLDRIIGFQKGKLFTRTSWMWNSVLAPKPHITLCIQNDTSVSAKHYKNIFLILYKYKIFLLIFAGQQSCILYFYTLMLKSALHY